jgi:hypothetical protein
MDKAEWNENVFITMNYRLAPFVRKCYCLRGRDKSDNIKGGNLPLNIQFCCSNKK